MPIDKTKPHPSVIAEGLAEMRTELQNNLRQSIVDRPHLKTMPTESPRSPDTGTGGTVMRIKPNEPPLAPTASGDKIMGPLKVERPTKAEPPKTDMKPRLIAKPGDHAPSYLTLRVRVVDNELQIVAAKEVEGPLSPPTMLIGEQAYEVILDGERLSVGDVPDFERRSYPRPGETEHYISQIQMPEFTVRLPKTGVTADRLERLRINVYRFANAVPKTVSPHGTLMQVFGSQTKLLYSLDGIRPDRIAPAARPHLQAIFPELKLE